MPRTTTTNASQKVHPPISPPPMAHQMMVQQTGKTFRDWANIREPPISDYPSIQGESHAMVNALTNAIKLQDFEDVLSQYFGMSTKIKDADKIFPREVRIQLLKDELQKMGSTNRPEGFDGKSNGTDAQYKYWVKKTFQFRTHHLQLKHGIIQKVGHLYLKMDKDEDKDKRKREREVEPEDEDKEQIQLKDLWEKQNPLSSQYLCQPPVTSVEDSYIHYIEAHIYPAQDEQGHVTGFAHRGRDETFDHLKLGISSSFPKALIARINAQCPACKPRVESCSKVGEERERVRNIERQKRKAENNGEIRLTQRRRADRNPPLRPAPVHQPLENRGTFGVLLQPHNPLPQPAPMYQPMDNYGLYGVLPQQYNIPPQPAPMYQPMGNHGPYGLLLQQHNTPLAPVYYPPHNNDLGAADFQIPQQSTSLSQPWINNTPAQPTSTSQYTQNNRPEVPYWSSMGPGYTLVCPIGHTLNVLNFWLDYDGTVREWHRDNQRMATTCPLTADSIPDELFNIALPPGVSHYLKPDPFTMDLSKQHDWYNQFEMDVLQQRLMEVLDDGIPFVQDNTITAIDPNESYPAYPFGSPPSDSLNDTFTSVPAPHNNTTFIDPRLLLNSNISDSSSIVSIDPQVLSNWNISNRNSAESDTGTIETFVNSEENEFQEPLEDTANVSFDDLFFGVTEEPRETEPASPPKIFYKASYGGGLIESKGGLAFPMLPASTNTPS